MKHSFLCVLGLFSLSTLFYGNAEESDKAILTADKTIIPAGGRATLTCDVMDSTDIEYEWFRATSSANKSQIADESDRVINICKGGTYTCRVWRGDTDSPRTESEPINIQETVSNRIVVMVRPSWSQIFTGETITLRCEIQGDEEKGWKYEWDTPNTNSPPTSSEYRISRVSVSHSGDYRCRGSSDYLLTEWSYPTKLTISLSKPRPLLKADSGVIPAGGSVYLTCSVEDSTGWRYDWFRITSEFSVTQKIRAGTLDHTISISEGGIYYCRGGRGDPEFFTEDSLPVRIKKRVWTALTKQPKWSQMFSGEIITLSCEVQDGPEWKYEWMTRSSEKIPDDTALWVITASVSSTGTYWCKGNHKMDRYLSTPWSDPISLTVSSVKPKAEVRTDMTAVPVEGSVTLTCSVNPSSSGWKYYWHRDGKSFKHVTPQGVVFHSKRQLSVSQEGVYWCRGARGNPVYYTEYSQTVRIGTAAPTDAVVTLQPDWPIVYSGEMITLSCEIQRGHTEWEYEWRTTSSYKPSNQSELRVDSTSPSNTGHYECRGRSKSAQHNLTEWSVPVKVNVSYNRPRPVLTVSPSWLSPGASVTLNCEVEHASAGWSFYWYKAVPDLSEKSSSYELLPDGSGTAQDSYIIHGQTHTAGYVCRAGRGDPEYHTDHSQPKFVWSADVHSAASLTVSPDRVQHFTSDSVSLTCEGNFTEWRVRKFSEDGRLYSDCRRMTGSTCNINTSKSDTAVYWCESGSGEFSNAVNITLQDSKSESVSFIVLLNVGVVFGIFLLLLCCYRKIKDACFTRFTQSLNINQSSPETHVYSSLLHGDTAVYESLTGKQ